MKKEVADAPSPVQPSKPKSEATRIPPVMWLLRIAALMVLIVGSLVLAGFLYNDIYGVKADPQEMQTVTITENTAGAGAKNHSVPAGSLTAGMSQEKIDAADHPLEPLLNMAQNCIASMKENVADYSATIVKKVRADGKLQPEQFIACKIRHQKTKSDSKEVIPFSVYTRFVSPKTGQEAIWVEGRNDDKLIAHGPPGLFNVLTVRLDPDGSLAMRGNRYTIRSIGMLNLVEQIYEKGRQDMQYDDCSVTMTRNVKIDDVICTRFEIVHEHPQDYFEFHKAEIYIDDKRNLPVAFASYLWPKKPGGPPRLLERYFYTNIKLNIGLTDEDFDPSNENYLYPGSK